MPIQNEKLRNSFLSVLSNSEIMPLDEFVRWALYDPEIGYYQSFMQRVGKSADADFFTSATLDSSLWGELLIESCCKLLGEMRPQDFVFVEIGTEPGRHSLARKPNPFKAVKVIRLGDPLQIPDNAIVFSNEWLDAQPFKRFRFDPESKEWFEIGVRLNEGIWMEEILPRKEGNTDICKIFPVDYNIPYTIDWPTGAESSLNNLLEQSWDGLFLTFDYGLDFQRICSDFPEGTGRSYRNHRLYHEILKDPGEQDITCHLCWNSLKEILENHNFTRVNLHNQESFFMNFGSQTIKSILENPCAHEEHIGSLKELIHPAHLGQKFQALTGKRGI